jgi:hypothetical protein
MYVWHCRYVSMCVRKQPTHVRSQKRKAGTGRAGRTRRKRQRKVESEGEVLSLEALNHKSECLCSDDLAAVVGQVRCEELGSRMYLYSCCQLGYVPSNLVRVAARSGNGKPRRCAHIARSLCSFAIGEPTVVLLYPIKEGDEGGSRRYSGIAQVCTLYSVAVYI